MTTRDEWADALIAAMAWEPGVRDGIVAQASQESTSAAWNPLATTMPGFNTTGDFNTAGVKNYPTETDGIAATKATLENGLYPGPLAAGAAGDAGGYVRAIANGPWGTWHDEASAENMLRAVQSSPSYGEAPVEGPGSQPPFPAPPVPPPAPVPPPEVTVQVPQLKEGARGGSVVTVQAILNAKHQSGLATDGIFGPATDSAVRSFQSMHGLAVDGIVGPATWDKLANG